MKEVKELYKNNLCFATLSETKSRWHFVLFGGNCEGGGGKGRVWWFLGNKHEIFIIIIKTVKTINIAVVALHNYIQFQLLFLKQVEQP